MQFAEVSLRVPDGDEWILEATETYQRHMTLSPGMYAMGRAS